ncbi:O-antigen ligase family protein [Tenacibaculum sp.]|uniref:O-antigen ligase family protein n=1 Tax=Tenacibaculum sp. TaxID=1906242 RepID=UPI003AA7B342
MNINFKALFFITITGMSILLNDIDEVFNSNMRWVAWLLVVMLFGPLIYNKSFINFRVSAFYWTLKAMSVITIISFCWYIIGLPNLGRGIFTGASYHSMLLGPIAGISAVSFLINYFFKTNKIKSLLFFSISVVVCILTASRTALFSLIIVSTVVTYIRYRKQLLLYSAFAFSVLFVFQVIFIDLSEYSNLAIFDSLKNKSVNNTRQEHWNNRILEFEKSPIVGIGFASIDLKTSDTGFNVETGGIEPGSSWLSILSMTGFLGCISFFVFLWPIYSKGFSLAKKQEPFSVKVFCVNMFFLISFISEGYIFASGSILALVYWLSLGAEYSLVQLSKIKNI